MKTIEENIKAIIIPSCNYFGDKKSENMKRVNTAIEFSKANNLPKRFIISGLGTDANLVLNYNKDPEKENLDFHKFLYDSLMNETDLTIGIDYFSVNSIENILEVFPKGVEGKYALVSYPLHLRRFKKIIKDAKSVNKISKDIEVIFVPTKQHVKWIPYEILSNLKYHLAGKQKYFGKK